MYNIFTIFEMVIKDFKDREVFDKYYDELEYLAVEHFLLYGAFRFLKTDHYQDLMTKSFKFVKDNFKNYKNNRYLKTLGLKNRLFLKTNGPLTLPLWHLYFKNK